MLVRRLTTATAAPIPPPPPPPPGHPRGRGRLVLGLAAGALVGGGLTYAWVSPSGLLHHTEPTLREAREAVAVVQRLRADPAWTASDPYAWLVHGRRERNFSTGTLLGARRMGLTPLLFHNAETGAFVCVVHVGDRLCGHDGVLHGGVLATLCDEMTARAAMSRLTIAVTANLNINYRRMVTANQFLVLSSTCTRVDGRKAWAEATIADEAGDTLVEATALFVAPKTPLDHVRAWQAK